MKNTIYLKLLKYLIQNFNDNSKFVKSNLEEVGFKYATLDKNLKLIIRKYNHVFSVDNSRTPFEYTLLDHTEFIKTAIKKEIPDFLQEYIIINIKTIKNDDKQK